ICNPLTHCGMEAHVQNGKVIKVEGAADNPHNRGTLCSKGAASRQYIYHPDRLLTPLLKIPGKGLPRFEPISWEQALDIITEQLLNIKETSGPQAVTFYAGYPKWMRPFLKRLAHSFGSPNFCSESSTCASAAQMASRLNYGAVTQPDLAHAKCMLVWSRNQFYTNTTAVGPLLDAIDNGLQVIEVGPLITPLTPHTAYHLRIRPGTSGALALAMAHVMIDEDLHDSHFVEHHTVGFDAFRAYLQDFSPAVAERITGVAAEDIAAAARLYARTKPACMLNGASPTVHHTNGVQNHRAITALIGLSGNYNRRGGNLVSAGFMHMPCNFPNRERAFEQSRPWQEMAPRIGDREHPVWSEMIPEAQAMRLPFQIQEGKPYPIRALLAFGINYRMWPGSDFMRQSLTQLDFFVNVDLFMTDTSRLADMILPACSSFERSELKVYPENFAIMTRPVIAPLGRSRPDVDIIFDLASRLAPRDKLLSSGYEACMDWMVAPSGITVKEIRAHPRGYHWTPETICPSGGSQKNDLPTPTGKMELASTLLAQAGFDPLPRYCEPALSPVSRPDLQPQFPLVLTTGARLPMFVHSRTDRLGWLRRLHPEPMVDMNPRDAADRSICAGDEVTLATRRGRIQVKANLTEMVAPGVASIYHEVARVDVNELIEPDYVDPISGFAGFKSLLCEIQKIDV
nr:molybdopterin-dependent oxidoreductase [Desulfobacterales bacterium]